MIVLVAFCGGRRYKDFDAVDREMAALHAEFARRLVVVEGGAPGADSCARRSAEQRGIPVIEVPANWAKHGKAAGIRRNAVMESLPLQRLVAFPGGTGTADMVRRCRAKGIEVNEVGGNIG